MRIPFFGDKNEQQGGRPKRDGDPPRPPPPPSPAPQPASASPSPFVPAPSFPQLASMSTAELERALLDQAAFEELLQRVAAAAARGGGAPAEVDALRRDTAELARANLAREAEIEETRRQIAIVRSTDYSPARAAFDEKFKRQEAAREHIAPEKLIERLNAAAGDAEREAAELEKQHKAGGLGLDEFVEQYTALRMKYHVRDMKYQAALQTIPTAQPPGQGAGSRAPSFSAR